MRRLLAISLLAACFANVRSSDPDHDSVANDQCPNAAEDVDGFEDIDGCPDLDDDRDTVLDADDRCPRLPEDADGFEDTDGCPEIDNDHDTIADATDRCPVLAEDLDGFEDADGCPDTDDDGDTVADANDLCPRISEDLDGFEDADGCPDADNDLDRIVDADDTCPNLAEIYNGFLDDDGCPDPVVADTQFFTDNKFVLAPVMFAANTGVPPSGDFLARLARWLKSEPRIEVFAIIGHVEAGEPVKWGLARANAIAATLFQLGVPRERLVVHNAGTVPAREWAKSTRPDGADRSVHFRIFKVEGKSLYHWAGSIDMPSH